MRGGIAACGALAAAFFALPGGAAAQVEAPTLPKGFRETIVFGGLNRPTAVRFLPDGRVFVAERSGRIKIFDGLGDPSPTLFADLSDRVYDFGERGLLGLEIDPSFELNPYVYVLYTLDALPGGSAPYWNDSCPPPGPLAGGCVASARVARLPAAGNVAAGPEEVLLEGWCQQFPSHTVGSLAFDSHRTLYVSGGDGADFQDVDYGQKGDPPNPCGDPAGEGGALRSQDLRTTGDPTGLSGSLLRLDPDTGEAVATNPLFSSADANARRVVAHGFRNPFRFTIRPGTREVWIGDVGWRNTEEIDRIPDAADLTVENFGWPCYEGTGREASYDAADLALCEDLYEEEDAVTGPSFSYRRTEDVVPDDPCPNGLTISALEFYEDGAYPEEYEGALFFADLARSCIWVVFPGPGGEPDFDTRQVFMTEVTTIVDLQAGPGGDLFYVDHFGGSIRRLEYPPPEPPRPAVENTLPTASVLASVTRGAAPLAVAFDASRSNEPDAGDSLSYAWDLDGDEAFDDGVGPSATRVFKAPGTFRIRVRATDRHGGFDDGEAVVRVRGFRPLLQLVQLEVNRRGGRYFALLRFRACDDSSAPLLIHRQELVGDRAASGALPSRSFYRYLRGSEARCRSHELTWRLPPGFRAGRRYQLVVRLADAQLNWSATVARSEEL
ncbi:MAG: PQQ-dependent sugar dehydrogenase [Gaiellaceae bacterium]